MIEDIIHSRISKILIVGVVVLFVVGCSEGDSYDPHQKEPPWTSSKVTDRRREVLLKEMLIEMQETNAMLQEIVQTLEVENGSTG